MNSVEILSQAAKSDSLTHAYLAPVRSGTNLEGYAAELGQTILCPPDAQQCTRRVVRRTHPDYHLVTVLNDNRKISISQVDEIISGSSYSPVEADKKVYVISRAEDLSPEGANSLLKILEDPPDFVYFLLLSEAPHSLLPTIISRCQQLPRGGSSVEGMRALLAGEGFETAETDYLLEVVNRKSNLLDELLEADLRSPLERKKNLLAEHEDNDLIELSEKLVEKEALVELDVLAGLIFEKLEAAGNFELLASAAQLKELSREELEFFLEKGLNKYRTGYREKLQQGASESQAKNSSVALEKAKAFDRTLDSLETNANLQLLIESLWLQLSDLTRNFNEPSAQLK